MADGFYSNVTSDTELILYNIPEKPTGIEKKWAKAMRIGNACFFEFYFKLGENFEIPRPEVYNNDRFAVYMKRPLYQFAPMNFQTHLPGSVRGGLYLQGGWNEGIYDSLGTVRLDQLRNFWVITLWTVQTELHRNGRVEKVCLDYPAKGYDIWKGSEIWGWAQFECVKEAPLIQRAFGQEPAVVDYTSALKELKVDLNTVIEMKSDSGQTLR